MRAAITVVLKNAGVEFINGDEPGVKLKRPPCYDGLRSDQLNAENDGDPRANVRELTSGPATIIESSPHHRLSEGLGQAHMLRIQVFRAILALRKGPGTSYGLSSRLPRMRLR